MATLSRQPLADQAAELLLERIRSGEWMLGQKLPSEVTLAPQLGVGRSTVREAIRQLAGRGVLRSRQGSGVFVMALEPAEERDPSVLTASIITVIEARIAIEVEASAHAATRRTPAQLRALRRLLSERDPGGGTTPTDVESLVDTDVAFHRAIVAASGNEILAELFDSFAARLRHAMTEMLRAQPMRDAHTDHRVHADIVEAIARRDAASAAQLTRTHLTVMKERFE
ncbi:FadR/GntR family transcriptional regulator [Paramicrobacterium fandaimingii]|uniref:FadR/GntR family transcriptional regulator n=1 Tax=Paramicrobacterium fandaimingii TaxID=2708079 RepID=UPI001420A736|nr:FadR/GntR family transcriptional regulator [Microbacterium fandaimingii]